MRIFKRKWFYEVCKKCHRNQRLIWSVKDSVWKDVVPKKFYSRVLCLECFLEFASKKKIIVTQDDLICLGWLSE